MSANKRPVTIVRPGSVPTLKVLGADVTFVCEAEQTNGQFSVMVNELPFGAGPPPHHHDWDEAYYIMAGEIEFTIDGERATVGAGTFVHTPAGTVHGFRGMSQEPAKLIVIDAPAHAAEFFRAVDREVGGPADFPRVPAIGDAHGIHFMAA